MITVSILMLAIEMQFCLAVTARLDKWKYAQESIGNSRKEKNQCLTH